MSQTENENLTPASSEQESSMSIIEIINMLLQHWFLIAVLAISFGAGTYIFNELTTFPTYTTKGVLYINTQNEQVNSDININAIKGSFDLMPTYIEILQSKSFLQDVSNKIDNKYDPTELKRMIHLSSQEETNLLTVQATSLDSHDAFLICQSILNLAGEEITYVFEGGSVKIIDAAEEPTNANPSGTLKRSFIGFLGGMALGIILMFVLDLFNTRVKSPEELVSKYSIPVLGEAPNLREHL